MSTAGTPLPAHGQQRGPLTSQHNSTVLLCFYLYTSPSLSEQRKVRKQQHDLCRSWNEGPPYTQQAEHPARGQGPAEGQQHSRQAPFLGQGLQSQACLGQLGADTAPVPSQTRSNRGLKVATRWES